MARNLRPTEVRVPCRISYAHVLDVDKNGKYSCCLLIPKTDKKTIDDINKAVNAAIQEGKSKLGNKDGYVNVKTLKLPLRDADEEGNTNNGYEGMMFFNARNDRRPQIVNRRCEPIFDEDEIYSGCYCKVMINFFAFAAEGNKGITASLGNIQKLRDGENLAFGRSNAEDDFDVEEDDDEL